MSPISLIARAAKAGVLMGLLVFAIVFALVVKARVGTPFDLEWMEGLVIDGAIRLSLGRSLYPPPNADFMPSVYTPLYSALVAGIFKIFGTSYLAARAASVAATVGITCGLFLVVKRETRSNYWGLVSAGFFLAAFRFTGAWYDLARVDSLALALVLLAAWIAIREVSPWTAGLVGILMFCAVFTKQSTVFFFPAFFVVYLLSSRTAAAVFTIVSVALITVGFHLGHILTNGWSTYYTIYLPTNQPATSELAWRFLRHEWFTGAPFLLGLSILLALALVVTKRSKISPGLVFILLLTMLGFVAAFLSFARVGGYDNVLMLAVTPAVLLVGAVGGQLEAEVSSAWPRLLPYLQIILGLFLIGQMALWVYSPAEQVPTKGDYLADQRLREYLASLDGNIYSPQRGFLVTGLQGPVGTHQYSIVDVSLDKHHHVGFPEDLAGRLRTGYYRYILLDRRWQWQFDRYLSCYYVESPDHSIRIHSPRTRTGLDVQLDTLLVYAGPRENCSSAVKPS